MRSAREYAKLRTQFAGETKDYNKWIVHLFEQAMSEAYEAGQIHMRSVCSAFLMDGGEKHEMLDRFCISVSKMIHRLPIKPYTSNEGGVE